MGTPVIELLDAEIAWTDENVGRKQRLNAIEQGRTPNPGTTNDPDDAMRFHILGGRCEAAAYKWAKPVRWNIQFSREKIPDLHDFIDVKGVAKSHHNLALNPHDTDEWAYLLVDGTDHPVYKIVGWCWGFEAKTLPREERRAGSNSYFVDRDNPLLKSPESLLLVLRERQLHPLRSAAAAAHR